MKQEKPRMGFMEIQFFAWIQLKKINQVKTGELCKALGLTEVQERKLLSRMAKRGLIARLRKGLYLVPDKIPAGGKWRPNEYILLARFMDDLKAEYQIGGPTAFNFYGLDEQVSAMIFVYNDKISGKRKIGGLSFSFIKVPKERLGSYTNIKNSDGSNTKIATLPRALLDAVYDWSRFNTLPKAYEWIKEKKEDKKIIGELIKATLKYGNIASNKRIGYTLEKMGINVKSIKTKLPSTSSFISFIPNKDARGKCDKIWGLIING